MALLYTELKKRKDDPMIQKMKHEIENVPLAQEGSRPRQAAAYVEPLR